MHLLYRSNFGKAPSKSSCVSVSQTPCLPWISSASQKLMLVSCQTVKKKSEAFHTFLLQFFKFKTEFYCISFFLPSRLHFFEIHQLLQSGFSRVYSNSCCSCLFKAEIINVGQSSHKMYSNNILNFQESMTFLNACTQRDWKLIEITTYIYIYIHISL